MPQNTAGARPLVWTPRVDAADGADEYGPVSNSWILTALLRVKRMVPRG